MPIPIPSMGRTVYVPIHGWLIFVGFHGSVNIPCVNHGLYGITDNYFRRRITSDRRRIRHHLLAEWWDFSFTFLGGWEGPYKVGPFCRSL